MSTLNIAWWNLENLFDHENALRPPELKSKLKSELKGWTANLRDKKISQLAKIIKSMFNDEGPALLGVCEIENEEVLKMLAGAINNPNRKYEIAAHQSPDARGIDISFIYDEKELSVLAKDHQVVIKRTATRDIFWIRLKVIGKNAEFVAIANHWPSRSSGQYSSEPFRMLTGETLAYIVSQMLDVDNELPIISMGDFNDEPFNRAMQEYLLGTRDPGRVRYSHSGHMLNLMWPLMQGHDPGTYLFDSDWNMLDQFLVSYGMLRNASKIKVKQESVELYKPDILKADGGKARKFSRPSAKSGVDIDGFSDHFPILVKLEI
ncbi:MAG: hypothetical protein JXA96_08860 [Sedimentisphaerales bacterium]|nr:hypothetical protein [Sedimentisphaerales bacterium]